MAASCPCVIPPVRARRTAARLGIEAHYPGTKRPERANINDKVECPRRFPTHDAFHPWQTSNRTELGGGEKEETVVCMTALRNGFELDG